MQQSTNENQKLEQQLLTELPLIDTTSSQPFINTPVVRRSFMWYDTDDLIDCLPQNRPLYKDSGLWAIRTDDMENVYMTQNCNEPLRGFIIRYLEWLEEHSQTDDVWMDLACKEMSS